VPGPLHGYRVARRIKQIRGSSENNRRARFVKAKDLA
jgi:hypothetical protein